MATYQHRDVIDTPDDHSVTVTRSGRFSPGQILGGLLGVLLVIVGTIAVVRTGIDSSLNTPATRVLGFEHSALLGLIEIGAGLLLLVGASNITMRGVMGTVGGLLFIGGVVIAAGNQEMLLRLGTESSTGWALAVVGAVAVMCAALPSFVRSDRVTSVDAQR